MAIILSQARPLGIEGQQRGYWYEPRIAAPSLVTRSSRSCIGNLRVSHTVADAMDERALKPSDWRVAIAAKRHTSRAAVAKGKATLAVPVIVAWRHA